MGFLEFCEVVSVIVQNPASRSMARRRARRGNCKSERKLQDRHVLFVSFHDMMKERSPG